MPHTDTSKSQSTSRASYHASHRHQQITGNKSCILPCLTQIPANHRQQIVHLTMPHTETRKSQATNRTSCHASHRYKQIAGNKSYILLTITHTDTSESQATNVSHRYQQIIGNKSYILPYLITPIPASHRQQIGSLAMPHTGTCKSQATSRASYHVSHRYQQIIGNKSSILPCPTHIQANHRQPIVHLTMPHTETSTSQATDRTSYHDSHRYQQITGNKSYILQCLTQIPANHRQQVVPLTMLHTGKSKS